MDLKGKITIFPEVKERELEDGKVESFIACRGTISSKNEKGGYINKSVNVKFSGKEFPKEAVNKLSPEECYSLDVEEGFLSVSEFETSKGTRRELEIVVLKGKLLDHKVVQRKEPEVKEGKDGLPF